MHLTTARFRRFTADFQWIHQGIGLLGGLTFFVGSILFLFEGNLQRAGIWLFIIGSAGMLVGNAGSFLAKYERHELNL
jgi:hypothetical protein